MDRKSPADSPREHITTADDRRALIRSKAEVCRSLVSWKRLLPAWISSGVLHACLLALLLLVSIPYARQPSVAEPIVIETRVEDDASPANLVQTDLGMDPEIPTQFNNPRIELHSVPGPLNPNDAIGLLGGTDQPPVNIPPPAGLGPSSGQGGGLDALEAGKGKVVGLPGGVSGGIQVPGGFGGRSGATREQLLREGGGNRESEAAVARGLVWFAKHQAADGHWSLDGFSRHGHCNCNGIGRTDDIAATALGLLPMLGAGQTHRAGTDAAHLYSKNVERALKFLISNQDKRGNFGGDMYSHGLATIAICEAYGLTGDPGLQNPAQRAINFIVAAQSARGGWRYQPRESGDTSVAGWQIMALKSGQMAGLQVPAKTLAQSGKWLDSCASPDGGGYGYQGPGDGPTSMTAVGLLCRQYLGWGARNPGLQAGIKKLKELPPSAANTIYYTYYATQVMYHTGGEAWEFWNPKVRDLLIAQQDRGLRKAHQAGSWDPKGDLWGGGGGRIMVSSLALLTLEVYYRYLPLYRRDQVTRNQ